MYSYDDRIRAVRLYIQYDKSAAAVIRELGYPERKTLRYWYEEYLRDNGLKKKFVRSPKYNGAQKEAAVKHYMEHGECASRTIRALGYPSRALLKQWVTELCPEEKPHCSAGRSMVHLTKEQKDAGLIRSMSKKGCSPDNSACEGFFGRLKNEMFYGHSWQDVSIDKFIKILNDYMHWYAEERIKISLGGISPIQYRRQLGLTV